MSDVLKRTIATPRGLFVGREREMEELSAGLDAALRGRGSSFLLTGEAGIGKTRLVDHFAEKARERGAVVLWGRSWEGEGAPPFWCWIQILRAYLKGRDRSSLEASLPGEMAAVAKIVPSASGLGALATVPGGDSEQQRFEQFEAITSFFAEASANEPLLLVFDDLHASDLSSLFLLRFFTRALRDLRVLVIAAARGPAGGNSSEASAVLSDLVREGTHLPIFGLAESEVARFLPTADDRPPPAALVREVHSATGGNPLFILEVSRGLAAETREGAFRIPLGLQTALRRRLSPLPSSAHEVLSIASVVGREFDVALLQEISERPFEQIVAILDSARADGIVTETQTPAVYRFSHGLFRELLYGDVRVARRLELHRAVADSLLRAARDGAKPLLAEIAHHLVQAAPIGKAGEAVEYSWRAGQAANLQLAYEEAVLHFERAVQLFETYRPGEPRREAELLVALAEAMRRAGYTERMRDAFTRAADAAARCGATDLRATAMLRLLGRWAQEVAASGETVRLLTEILAKLPEDEPLRATVLARLVQELLMSNEHERCRAMAAEALAVASRTADPSALAYVRDVWLWAFRTTIDSADLITAGSEILEIGLAVADAELAVRGHDWRVIGFLEQGVRAKVDAEIETMERLVTRLRQPYYRWQLTLMRTLAATIEGRFAEAEAAIGEAFQLAQPYEPTNAMLFFGVQLFHLRREQGRLAEMDQMFEDFARQYGNALPALRITYAFLHAVVGRMDEASAILDDLWETGIAEAFRGIDASSAAAMISETVVLLGDAARAAELYRVVEPMGARGIVVGNGLAYFGSFARVLALLADTAGDEERATAWFERALQIHRRMRARPLIARTAIEYARHLRRRKDSDASAKAAALHAEGLDLARALGMTIGEAPAPAPPAPVPPGPAPPAAKRPGYGTGVFRFEGSHWHVEWVGQTASFPDRLGFRYIARLLVRPRNEIHAGEIVRGDELVATDRAVGEGAEISAGLGHAGEILDAEATAQYRSRARELRAEIDAAEREGRGDHAARLHEELDFLSRELAAAHGLGGRRKKAVDSEERLRKAVRNRIRSAIEMVAERHEPLGRHLANSIRTGIFCSYEPEELVDWWT